jgi:hypothetical protein
MKYVEVMFRILEVISEHLRVNKIKIGDKRSINVCMEKTFMELEKNSPLHRRPKASNFHYRELFSGY